MDMCKISIIGRVQPRDPEPRFTPDGRQVTTFRLVCNRQRRGKDGERVEEAEWFQVTTFGRLAETCANLVTKGSRLLVEGRFNSRVWQDNEGKPRTSLEILANDVILLDQRQRDPSEPYAPAGAGQQPQQHHDSDLEDLPF